MLEFKVLTILSLLLGGVILLKAQSATVTYQSLDKIKTIQDTVFDFTSLDGVPHVFVFFARECPLSQKYTLTMSDLYMRYAKCVQFIGVFVEKEDTASSLCDFEKKYRIKYPIIQDKEQQLASLLNATVTPEVFLIDRFGKIVYRGAIDDWFIALGKAKNEPSNCYLDDAIKAILSDTQVKVKYVKPIGCYIE